MVTPAELSVIAKQQRIGNADAAQMLIKNLQKEIFLRFDDGKIGMDKQAMNKRMGNMRKRISRSNGRQLDGNKTDEYLTELQEKWDLSDILPREDIIGPVPNAKREKPSEFTFEYFTRIIGQLPNHKSPGISKITNEMIKYASDRAHKILYEIFTTMLRTGITPTHWSYNSIIPIYKQKGPRDSMKYQRPLCLMKILKKLMEGILLPEAHSAFPKPVNQFGYTKNTSTIDAAHVFATRISELKEANKFKDYSINKYDACAAFDRMLHSKIEEFIMMYIKCPMLQYLFKSMLLAQNLCLSIGTNKSRFMQMRRGILQGSRFSPLFFICLVDWAFRQGNNTIQGLLLIFADDFLILSLIQDRTRNMATMKSNLSFIGLTIAEDKSYEIIDTDRWVGIACDQNGLSIELQFKENMARADKRLWTLVKLGNWKSHYPDNLALCAYRSQVINIMEYGLAAFDPCTNIRVAKELSARVDIMINRHLRIILGMPIYLPIEDMRSLFQYSSFYNRWCELRSRFYNHLSSETNQPDLIQYAHPCPWSFTIVPCIEKLIAVDKTMRSFLLRLYAKPDVSSVCVNCNEHHSHVNQTFQCFLKNQSFLGSSTPTSRQY